jgi:hypothetical protein
MPSRQPGLLRAQGLYSSELSIYQSTVRGMRRPANGLVKGHRWAARLWTVMKKENWPELVALTSVLLSGAAGNRTRSSTRQNAVWTADSVRFGPARSRSLPAVSFSGLDGVKRASQRFCGNANCVDGINTPVSSRRTRAAPAGPSCFLRVSNCGGSAADSHCRAGHTAGSPRGEEDEHLGDFGWVSGPFGPKCGPSTASRVDARVPAGQVEGR